MNRGPVRRPTQADIARLAGVSQATVSLVLNDRDSDVRISPATRQRVLAAMREWGYVANLSARSLAGGRSRIIGVYTFEPVFPTTSVDFYFPFLLGMEQQAAELGYDLLLFTSAGGQRQIFRDGTTRLSLADGALLLGRYPNTEEIEQLRDFGYPFVYVGHREVSGPPVSYVAADYTSATQQLTERLFGLGHEHVAYARIGDGDLQPSRDREKGFRRAVPSGRERRLPGPVWTLESTEDVEGLLAEMRRGGITGLVAEQDLLAEEILAVAHRRGLSVPGDLSVVALGDTMGARGTGTDWTRLVVPREEMGRQATRLLVRLLEADDREAVSENVECPLAPGTTVGPPAGGGEAPRNGRES
ncbi:LacI family DNA-binding transcriptional regulator [Amycolatopsis endophytica]|uniref:DNA-binding LacI/PurR family transcriptional regulator n=1 Tax=Amycolatopsis endophytica TaxID=860233 RepID=A0A853B9I1_9PSEU|nr:LacI family DNA-binding transcriptional regulator [Amycolatopsis endophytica]NYI91422.1 DNA-binding LacI/PurR family transcriptional regulator [Amycolatopsis endophytica]